MTNFLPDPKSIFYPYYIISALAFAFVWLKYRGMPLTLIFSKKIWGNRSTLLDLKFCLIHAFILKALVFAFEARLFLYAYNFMGAKATPAALRLPVVIEAWLATLVTMLFIDFASYAIHRLMHRSDFLWRIHSIHHSAVALTPLTTYRQHPIEPFILYGARGISGGLGLGLFYYFFPAQTSVFTIWGMGAGFFLYMFTVNLHHFPVPVCYPKWLRKILISPHVHHLHHSSNPEHFGRNFGVVFYFWDRFFGTYHDEEIEAGTLAFGLEEDEFNHSLARSLLMPLKPAKRRPRNRRKSLFFLNK